MLAADSTINIDKSRRRSNLIVLLALLFVLTCMALMLYSLFDSKKAVVSSVNKPKMLQDKLLFRRSIVDRNNYPLAVNVPVYDLFIDPRRIHETNNWQQTYDLLELISKKINKKLPINLFRRIKQENKSRHLNIFKGLSPDLKKQIQQLASTKNKFLHWKKYSKRFYVANQLLANLIGLLDVNGKGQIGLEAKYDDYLSNTTDLNEQNELEPLKLSIDINIQSIASIYLNETIKQTKSESGVVLILDAKTGEVLANSVYPFFNSNNRLFLNIKNIDNRAFMSQFDPGSTIKPLVMLSLLNSNKYNLANIIDISPGLMRINNNIISDSHIHNWQLSVMDVIVQSSNIGMSKMALSINPSDILHSLDDFGFGYQTEVDFPGEKIGFLRALSSMQDIEIASMAYGYGIEVTMAQLASAYQAIANQGIRMPLSILALDAKADLPAGTKLMDKKTAKDISLALEGVVHKYNGTGKLARIEGYKVGGKTGTVRGYDAKNNSYGTTHRGLFVGIAPINNPDLIVAVMLNKPKTDHLSGGRLAAPLFAKIVSKSLGIRGVLGNNKFNQSLR